MNSEIMQKIHGSNVFEGFYHKAFYFKAYEFPTSQSKLLEDAIKLRRPSVIIEIGSYLGASAIHMAEVAKAEGIDTTIICIDTWLGDQVMLIDPASRNGLSIRNGMPQIYRQFLANICYKEFQNVVVPFPCESRAALRILNGLGIRSNLIYVDGSHDYMDAFSDLVLSREIFDKPGTIVCDDFDQKPVEEAVKGFVETDETKPRDVILGTQIALEYD